MREDVSMFVGELLKLQRKIECKFQKNVDFRNLICSIVRNRSINVIVFVIL